MHKKNKIKQNIHLNLIIIFLFVIFIIKSDFFRNLYFLKQDNYTKRMVDKYNYYPSDDNTKAEIKAYMDDCDVDYLSNDTKAELLEKLMLEPHSVPQIEEEYTYIESEIDTTTLQDPTWQECAFKHGKLGSPRWNSDNSKVLVKYELAIADGTLDEVKAVSGITALSHSECIEEMKKNEWSSE